MRRYKHLADVQKMMWAPERIRNIGIVAHVDHGKTTLTDSLVAASGIISSELAGEQLFTDFLDIEQQRGITVQTAAVSLAHTFEGNEYLINLLDTPGHVDFSGDVTRALRAIDGVVVVMDAVEGVMPQTETVLRQALQERARPVLFINKVDRLIDELKLTPEGIQARFIKLITKFNELIRRYAHPSVADKWTVSVEGGSVAFGSAKEKWALSVPQMKKKNISFKDIIEAYRTGTQAELAKKSPIYEVVLDMVIRHLPNPREAQAVRIPVIWKGDLESELGRDMLTANPDGKICMVITDIIVDDQAGVISTGRIFSGTIEKGKSVRLVGAGKEARIQQVNVYMGPDRVVIDKVPAGNIGAIIGLKDAVVGETLVEAGVEGKGFEELRYISEPVVTVAVEPKNFQELPKLINELKRISREDPNVKVKINEETGEYLVSGMGEVHLEIVQYKLKEAGLEVKTSKPIVVYREAVTKRAGPVEGKSPNRHNRFMMSVEPLEPEVIKAIGEGKVSEKQERKERASVLRELGWETHAARNVVSIIGPNVLVDVSKGVQYMREVEDYVIEAFKEVVEEGPIMREPMRGLKVLIEDATLHEDSVHRGPAQIIPAVRRPIQAAVLLANPTVLEPLLKLEVRVPQEFMGGATKVIQGRRGKILSMDAEEDITIIRASLPVANSFGLAAELRSETEGRAIWATEFDRFEQLPRELQNQVILDTRKRKGLKPEPPKPDEFMEK
ncbi:TPA: elongation factor EF-2 [Candidatus Poribacteria bacterium]|nr:elongation factor EF-2 [Candidatus Poribacteria bacterium]HEX30441.1 elongation factor EF-2 [Candidatus Poribacteria bacterium]